MVRSAHPCYCGDNPILGTKYHKMTCPQYDGALPEPGTFLVDGSITAAHIRPGTITTSSLKGWTPPLKTSTWTWSTTKGSWS